MAEEFRHYTTSVVILGGHPAASVPAEPSDDELPIGAQLVAERFGEETILTASAAVECCPAVERRLPIIVTSGETQRR